MRLGDGAQRDTQGTTSGCHLSLIAPRAPARGSKSRDLGDGRGPTPRRATHTLWHIESAVPSGKAGLAFANASPSAPAEACTASQG